jgi:hypothetical protein
MTDNQISIIFNTLGVLCMLAMAFNVFSVDPKILIFVGIAFFIVGGAVKNFRKAGKESSATDDGSADES